jgi:hypothetical protein
LRSSGGSFGGADCATAQKNIAAMDDKSAIVRIGFP